MRCLKWASVISSSKTRRCYSTGMHQQPNTKSYLCNHLGVRLFNNCCSTVTPINVDWSALTFSFLFPSSIIFLPRYRVTTFFIITNNQWYHFFDHRPHIWISILVACIFWGLALACNSGQRAMLGNAFCFFSFNFLFFFLCHSNIGSLLVKYFENKSRDGGSSFCVLLLFFLFQKDSNVN